MRLLFINSIGKKKWGGGEKWMVLAARELMAKGHHVVIGCRKNSVLQQRGEDAGLSVEKLSIYTDFSLLGAIQVARIVKREKIDLIVACQNKDVRVSGMVSKCINGPVVISRQGVQLLHKSNKYKWGFIPFCDGIITNTNSIKEEYDSYGWWDKDYVKVIYNGIPKANQKAIPFSYSSLIPSLNGSGFIILSTGRLAIQKGFQYLIEAAKSVVQNHKNVHFVIAGKGKLQHALQKQITDAQLDKNVHLIGFKDNITSLLKGADLFVLPSLYEGMPNSLMEALSLGIPAVSTDVNGVSELMKNKEHGYIVKSADANELSIAINKLIDDEQRQDKGKQALIYVNDKFSVERMVETLEDHLQECICKKSVK